jgi:hypothetical protein
VIAGIPHEELRHTRAAQEWLAEGRERLLMDLLPWCESWTAAIPSSAHRVLDPQDQVFLHLALAAATPGCATSS